MIRDTIEKAVREALTALGAPDVPFSIDYPPREAGADYATNAALAAAKALGKPPREVAEKLLSKLSSFDGVEKIEAAGPGFLNFTLRRKAFTDAVKEARSKEWGRNALYAGEKILLEYTSPNLFKPLHIGNLVGNILGESLARLLERSGAEVTRLNYPSDIGLTVAKGVWGLWKNNLSPADIAELGKAYVAGNEAYENDAATKTEIEDINRALYEDSNPAWSALRREGIETSRRHLDELCERLGTTFDKEFFESRSGPLGRDIVKEHIGPVFEESDGAVIYRGEQDGLHTRVFLNSQGLPTYEAKELGLFKLKSDTFPAFDISVTITGSEQRDFFAVVFAAIKKVFPDRTKGRELRHIANGFLKLTTGKMSSRKGNVITGESLLEDLRNDSRARMGERELKNPKATADAVAVGAVKYAVLKQGSGKDIVFDPQESLSLEGDSGPYVQYAHTRCFSILRKAKEGGVAPDASKPTSEAPLVEKLLLRFPDAVARAALEYEPHYVAQYLLLLASAFNSWYAAEHVLGTPEAPYKLAVVDAVRNTLESGLFLLGIKAPEEM